MTEIKAKIQSLYDGEEKTCYISCKNQEEFSKTQRALAYIKRKMNLDFVYGRALSNQIYVVRA